jgi:hypothetical protein
MTTRSIPGTAVNPYAPPRAGLEVQPAGGCWREGKALVMRAGSALPHRCVKCNEPAAQPIKSRWVYWHHPGWYLLILVNVLVYVLVALVVRKRSRIAPGLCSRHRRRRRVFLAIGWGGFFLGLAFFFPGPLETAAGPAIGMLIILAAIITGMAGARIAYAARITKEEVRLKGCGAAFLDSLESR